jgi:hypothetical protein
MRLFAALVASASRHEMTRPPAEFPVSPNQSEYAALQRASRRVMARLLAVIPVSPNQSEDAALQRGCSGEHGEAVWRGRMLCHRVSGSDTARRPAQGAARGHPVHEGAAAAVRPSMQRGAPSRPATTLMAAAATRRAT